MLFAAIQKQITNKPSFALVAWAAVATFTTYLCMYGFRKGISATTFDGLTVAGISFKSSLIIAQVFGYMVSKFIGIKFISELNKAKRGQYILLLIGSAHVSLLLFAIIPRPISVLFLFLNGMSLGLIWGLVFSYIEGRKFTDLLALILSINFIFSSGLVKSLGRVCIEYWDIPELYMPFMVGVLFFPLLILAVWMLNKIPPPTVEELNSRGKRIPLQARDRMQLIKKFFIGLVAIIAVNLILTILRDVKDNYAIEILRSVKPSFIPAIFTQMETIAALSVFFLLLILAAIRSHFKSIMAHHIVIILGLFTVLLSTWSLQQNIIDPVIALVTYTIGLYVCYNTLQCLFLDRFIAAFGVRGNIGFFFYLMDSIGYLGSCFIILNKEVFNTDVNWLNYFIRISYLLGTIGLISILIALIYFIIKHKTYFARSLKPLIANHADPSL